LHYQNIDGGKSSDETNFHSGEDLGNMSFYQTRNEDHLNPKAPPPAAALPPLPIIGSPPQEQSQIMGGTTAKFQNGMKKPGSKKQDGGRKKSSTKSKPVGTKKMYQQQYAVGASSVENYGTTNSSTTRGPLILDLNPVNNGLSNAKHSKTVALNEIVKRVHIINIVLCATTIVIQMINWIGNFFTFEWSRLILGTYLVFFAFLMCSFELHNPIMANHLRDNFGLLFNTGGRVFCYFIMGTMCLGQCNFLMYIIGSLMILNSVYTVYVSCRYPDFESVYEKEGTVELDRETIKNYVWTDAQPSSFISNIIGKQHQEKPEHQNLLKNPY